MSAPLIHDYIGLSEASSMERSSVKISSSSSTEDEKNGAINFKETELRLGLPGSQSPERKGGVEVSVFSEENKTNRYFLNPLKNFVSGAKRGFSDTIDVSGKWTLSLNGGSETDLGEKSLQSKNTEHGPHMKEVLPPPLKPVQEKMTQVFPSNQHGNAPAAKAQVVGWPPVQSFRKNIMATNSTKNIDDDDGKSGSGCLYVKVSMDGAPYLRKIDLVTYSNYIELSSALGKMFSCFTIGQCSSQGLPGREGLSESHITDLLHGSEYVLTYEDKDGDWMLVGDVPWQMFAHSCRRLRIMKGSDAIGLAPRAMEKCKNHS